MDVSTAQLYELLIDKGFERDRVRAALSEIVTKEEAAKVLASKADMQAVQDDVAKLRGDMYKALSLQTLAIIGAVSAIFSLFF